MSGTKDAHLWSGDRAEDLGVLILRRLSCAVTEVRRQEDVGIDAVATVLRRSEGRRLVARGSFFVQLKSASIKYIDYKGKELDWLFEQRLPLFFGWVDQTSLSLSVFAFDPVAMHCFPYRRLQAHPKLRLYPRRGAPLPLIPGQPPAFVPCSGRKDGGLDVYLGEAALSLSVGDTVARDRVGALRDVMDAWISIAQSSAELRHYGVFQGVAWETNQVPRLTAPTTIAEKNANAHAARNMSMALRVYRAIATQARATGTEDEKRAVEVVEGFMRRMGAKE